MHANPVNYEKGALIVLIVVIFVTLYYVIVCAVMLAWDINLVNTLETAENTNGFCVDGQTACKNLPNNDLGLPELSTTFSRTTATILADLVGRLEHAAKEYASPSSPPNYTLLKTVNDTTGNMFLGLWTTFESNAVQLYIVYRGTQTSAEWSRDLETEQVPWPPSESQSLVHKGFLSVYLETQTVISEVVESLHPAQVFVTGHSLGAAVATLTGLGLQQNNVIPKLVTYAFASPRVGNVAFADFVNTQTSLFRISNQADLVNDIPLAVMLNFNKPHLPYIYQHTGTNYVFNNNWGSWQNNHLIPIYSNCLKNPTSCPLVPIAYLSY